MSIARIVRTMRERKGITKRELSHRAGMHEVDIGRIESGKRGVSHRAAAKLAGPLGTSGRILLLADAVRKADKEISRRKMNRDEAMKSIAPLGELLAGSDLEKSERKFLAKSLKGILPDDPSGARPSRTAPPVAGGREGSGVKQGKPFEPKHDARRNRMVNI